MDVGKLEPLQYTAGGDLQWSSHCGKLSLAQNIKHRITI
jgi:hypothetical protein